MPAWSVPRTWVGDEIPGATEMNTHVRDNLGFLKDPSFQQIVTASAGDYLTTASTAVPIDTANLSITMTTYGGAIHCFFAGMFSGNSNVLMLNLLYDNTAFFPSATGIMRCVLSGNPKINLSWDVWVTGLASGSHTFRPAWNTLGLTAYLLVATAPATFWAREG